QIQYGNTYLIDLMEGMKSLFSNKKVRLLIMIVLTSETFGWSVEAILPIIARDELGVDSIGLGYLMSAGAVGASITSLLISLLPEVKNKGLMVTVGLTGFGLCLILFSTSDIFWISTILLGFTYAFGLCYETSINTMLQTTVSPSMRGRALSFQTFGWGFSGMAGFMTGTIAMFLGAPIAVAAGGTVIAIQGIRTARKMFNIGVSSTD
ncbi:MAG: MFS transporter, partial [Dehalococcoidia bacterium]